MPVACYLKKDALAYITGSRIAILFQAAARAVHPVLKLPVVKAKVPKQNCHVGKAVSH